MMDEFVVPPEAVERAARVIWDEDVMGAWDRADPDDRAHFLAVAERALRAALSTPCATCGGTRWEVLHSERTPDGGIDELSRPCPTCGSGVQVPDHVALAIECGQLEQVGYQDGPASIYPNKVTESMRELFARGSSGGA